MYPPVLRTRLLLVVPCLFVTSLLGAAAPKERTSKQSSYARAMSEGRKAEQAADPRAAMQAFGRAVELRPQSAQALSELGWAAFLAGDLSRAEQASHAAASLSTCTEHQRAASLYNLGRVVEARGDIRGAVKAYTDSLTYRASSVVLSRLAQIDPQAAAAADPLRPQPMSGPFSSLAAYCEDQGIDPHECLARVPWGKTHGLPTKLPKPYRQVRLFRQEDDCHLAVQTERGFFVHPFTCAWHRFSAERADFAVSDIVPGGQPELVLRVFNRIGYKSDASEIDDDEGTSATISPELGICQRLWIVCGIGSSQSPSCSNLVLAEKDDCEEPPDQVNWSWQLAPLFGPDGKLELKPTGKIPLHGDRALPGLHILRFL